MKARTAPHSGVNSPSTPCPSCRTWVSFEASTCVKCGNDLGHRHIADVISQTAGRFVKIASDFLLITILLVGAAWGTWLLVT